jgi:DNA-binding MarR family transcriptional regulator
LNESRFNVLDALRRMPDGTSTQAALATALLQSESNLSTLLERMQHDGLITRIRSTADRRKSLIGLATAGSDALLQADHERDRVVTKIMRQLDEHRTRDLCETLELLLARLELELGIRSSGDGSAMAAKVSDVTSEDFLRPPHWQFARSSTSADVSAPHDGNQS